MTFPTSIQIFNGAHTGLGNTNNLQCTPDWARGSVYIHSVSSNPGDRGGYVSKSAILGGAETGFVVMASLDDATNHVHVSPPSALSRDGNLFMSGSDGMFLLDTTAWTRNLTWGEYTSPPYIFGPPPPPISIGSNDSVLFGGMVAISTPTKNLCFGLGLGSVSLPAHHTFLCHLPDFAGLDFVWPGFEKAFCSGAIGSGDWFMTTGNTGGGYNLNIYHLNIADGGTWVPSDWPTPNPQVSNTLLHSYAPSDIEATYTAVNCSGMCLDQTDGHLLAFVNGQSGNNKYFLIKFSSADGSIIWQTQTPGTGTFTANIQMQYSNVSNGIYCVIGRDSGVNKLLTFDTTNGTFTTQTSGLGGLGSMLAQSFNSSTGAIIANLVWTGGVDSPTPLGGSTPSFGGWVTLYVANPPPAATVISYTRVWGNFG